MTVPLIKADVDLSAIAHNMKEFRRIVSPDVMIMPAVKANGYGHGAVEVSRIAIQNGADALGVSRVEEGIELRKAGLDAPVLIFGYTSPQNTLDLINYDLTATISQFDAASNISEIAKGLGKKVKVHLKIDSGMGRIGMLTKNGHPGECLFNNDMENVIAIKKMKGLELQGVYTHFATADHKDKAYAKQQFEIFCGFLEKLKVNGIEIPIKHAANSAALIELPETHLDMVRPGISFYGLYPSNEVDQSRINLKHAMELKSKIISLKKVLPGFRVSYGCTHVTEKETVIAVVAVGYADGYSRNFSTNGDMLVRGQRAPIVGRVCMDLTMIDVGHISGVSLEDEVVIFGSQNGTVLHVDELASKVNTINYEIVSALTSRVARVYKY